VGARVRWPAVLLGHGRLHGRRLRRTEGDELTAAEIRGRLEAATPSELELASTEPSMSGQHFTIRRKGVAGIRVSGHEYGHDGAYTDLLVHAPTGIARLLSALDAVEALANEWETTAGPESKAAAVYGPQKVSVEFAVANIRAAISTALEGKA